MNELYHSLLSWSRADESFEHGAINGLGLALQPAGSTQCTLLHGGAKSKVQYFLSLLVIQGVP